MPPSLLLVAAARIARRIPGALGLALRQKLYPRLLGQCGRGAIFGLDVWFSDPERVTVGPRATLDDGVYLETDEGGTISVGADAYVGRHTRLTAVRGALVLADRANLSTWVRLTARGGLTVGEKTLLGPHVALEDLPDAPITIGANVWLGAAVTAAPGVTVGDDTVVGTAARIETDLPPRTIAVGRPARVIKERRGKE